MSPESAARINSDYQLPLALPAEDRSATGKNPGNGSTAFQWSTSKTPLSKYLSNENWLGQECADFRRGVPHCQGMAALLSGITILMPPDRD